MSRAGLFGLVALGAAVIATGIGAVYVKYLTRVEFVALQDVRAERDALDVQWGRLQIEEAALTSHTRIEQNARQQLGMHLPQLVEVRILEVAPHGTE
jgi:cell division protein FtsL